MAEQEEEGTAVPIDWYVPKDIVSRYATNLIVQSTGHAFIISFFETQPPLIIGTREEQNEQLKKIKSIRAECVARVIVSPAKMPEIIEVLNTNLANYYSKLKESSDENE